MTMTEAEWLISDDAQWMNRCLRNQFNSHRRKTGKRKLRLFGCACCRRLWEAMTDSRTRTAVEASEQFADGIIDTTLLIQSWQDAGRVPRRLGYGWHQLAENEFAQSRAAEAAFMVAQTLSGGCAYADETMRGSVGEYSGGHKEWQNEVRELSRLLRDLFGNPFHPVTFNPNWRTTTAVALATQMYDSRDFSAMPILADALQDAGCDNPDILDHSRGTGPHVRGCWVVDLVLGKS